MEIWIFLKLQPLLDLIQFTIFQEHLKKSPAYLRQCIRRVLLNNGMAKPSRFFNHIYLLSQKVTWTPYSWKKTKNTDIEVKKYVKETIAEIKASKTDVEVTLNVAQWTPVSPYPPPASQRVVFCRFPRCLRTRPGSIEATSSFFVKILQTTNYLYIGP